MTETDKKPALRCKVRECKQVFAPSYGDARPYGEFWEHFKNMHGPAVVEEIVLTPDDAAAEPIPF